MTTRENVKNKKLLHNGEQSGSDGQFRCFLNLFSIFIFMILFLFFGVEQLITTKHHQLLCCSSLIINKRQQFNEQ